jgi:hypothetical protein
MACAAKRPQSSATAESQRQQADGLLKSISVFRGNCALAA